MLATSRGGRRVCSLCQTLIGIMILVTVTVALPRLPWRIRVCNLQRSTVLPVFGFMIPSNL